MSALLERIRGQRSRLPEHDLELWADVPVTLHGHHFHLFWDQTIDDLLGLEVGQLVRTQAAREAYHDLLEQLVIRLEVDSPEERLRLAETLFACFGQGQISLSVTRDGGLAVATDLHYGRAWIEKYGEQVRRRWPVDAVAAGFAAAATEIAFDLPRESVDASERECVALGDRHCSIRVQPGTLAPRKGPVLRERLLQAVGPPRTGAHEDRISEQAEILADYLGGISGDERGLARVFGLFLARQPSTYLGRVAAEAYQHASVITPGSLPLFQALLVEAAQCDAFFVFGGILGAPEWETIFGPNPTGVEGIVEGGLAIARAAGYGHWCLERLVPGEQVVVRSSATPESSYWLLREDRAPHGICWATQGAVLGLTQLAHRVDWQAQPELSRALYEGLFRAGPGWRVQETACLAAGDPYCELVCTRA